MEKKNLCGRSLFMIHIVGPYHWDYALALLYGIIQRKLVQVAKL